MGVLNTKRGIFLLVAVLVMVPGIFAQDLSITRLAVLPFNTKVLCEARHDFSGFGNIFAEDVGIQMTMVENVELLDRSAIGPVLQELARQRDSEDFFDQTTVVQQARLLRTDYLMHGTAVIYEPTGKQISLNVRLLENSTGRVVFAKNFRGSAEMIFQQSEELAAMLLMAMAVQLSREEEERIFPQGRAMMEAMLQDGSVEERIAVLRRALSENPDAVEGWRVLAQLYREKGSSQESYQALQEVISRDAEDYESLFMAAITASEGGHITEATEYFYRSLEAEYRPIDCLFNLALLKEIGRDGRKFGEGAEIEAAQNYYLQVLGLNANHPWSLYNLGYSHFVMAQNFKMGSRKQYEHIKKEVEYFERYLTNAPPEEAARKQQVAEQVAQHRLFLEAWEQENN